MKALELLHPFQIHAVLISCRLSGGIDSCATATMVFSMCRLVIRACEEGNERVMEDVKRLAKYSEGELPKTAQELCNQLFHSMSYLYTKLLYSGY